LDQTSLGTAAPARLRYLDGVVEYLWDAKNLRGLICLVERWSSVEPPSKTGRLYQVRAFLALRLMDRAWLQLKKLLEQDPDDMEALSMATEMFLDRGWPSRARKLLAEAKERMPGAPELPRLLELTQGPARTPPANAREIELAGAPSELLELAESFLSTGSFLRGRSLLERVRQTQPTNARVKDLLWALDGDFDAGDISPEELASQLAPTFQDHGMNFIDLEPPGTEEVTATRIPVDDDDIAEAEFPALFRRVGQGLPLMDDDTGEVTQARALASPEELRDPNSAPAGHDPDLLDGRHEDTEIMMVIPSGGVESVNKADANVHRRRSQDYDLRSTLDLAEYRRSMGVSAPSLSDLTTQPEDTEDTGDSMSVSLEDEDADLVVVTRRERSSRKRDSDLTDEQPAKPRGPIRVIEKHPISEPEPEPDSVPVGPTPGARPPKAAKPAATLGPQRPRPAKPAVRPQRPSPPRPMDDDDDFDLPRRRRPGLVLFGLMVLGAVVVGLGLLITRLPGFGSGHAMSTVSKAISSDRYDELLKAETEIGKHLPDGEQGGDPVVLASAARIELALWAEHQPYPERLTEASALIERAMAGAEPPPEAHLAAAELAAWQWRIEDAQRSLTAYGAEDADTLLVRAMLASIQGDDTAAIQAAQKAAELTPNAPRAARILTQLQLEADLLDPARASLDRALGLAPANPRLAILALAIEHHADPGKLPSAARELSAQLSQRYTPARVEAELFERVAVMLPGTGPSATRDWAYQQAYAKDATDPDLLLFAARQDRKEQRLTEALEKLDKAVHFRPGDLGLRLAMVRLLIDLDRMDQANQQVQEAAALRPDHPDLALLRAWPLVMDKLPTSDAASLGQVQAILSPVLQANPEHAEALWLLGVAKLAAKDPSALADLTKSNQHMLDVKAPSQRELVSRALASLVMAGHPGTPRLLEHLDANAQDEPWVHLFLAWSNAARGAKSQAARRFAMAVEAGPELARAHYEQGEFHSRTARDRALAREAFGRYLRLEPSGTRAVRARSAH